MKTLVTKVFTVFIAIVVMTFGVFASTGESRAASSQVDSNQPTDNRVWQISLTARVLKVDADSIWVHIQSPDNMKINDSDLVQSIQWIPYTNNTSVMDSDSSTLGIDKIVSGQKVKVKFTYQFVGSARLALPIECKSVAVQDTLIKAKSTKTISELKDNTMIASIVEINNNEAKVFIEGGKMLSGSTSYSIFGQADINLASASVKDVDGNKIMIDSLEKYDRVIISAENHIWNETEPPTYAAGDAVAIQVLAAGENVVVPE